MNANLLNKVIYQTRLQSSTFYFERSDNKSLLNSPIESYIKPSRIWYTGIFNIPEDQTFCIKRQVHPEIKIDFKPGIYSLNDIWYYGTMKNALLIVFFSMKIKEASKPIFSQFDLENVKSNGLNGTLTVKVAAADEIVTIKSEKYLGNQSKLLKRSFLKI